MAKSPPISFEVPGLIPRRALVCQTGCLSTHAAGPRQQREILLRSLRQLVQSASSAAEITGILMWSLKCISPFRCWVRRPLRIFLLTLACLSSFYFSVVLLPSALLVWVCFLRLQTLRTQLVLPWQQHVPWMVFHSIVALFRWSVLDLAHLVAQNRHCNNVLSAYNLLSRQSKVLPVPNDTFDIYIGTKDTSVWCKFTPSVFFLTALICLNCLLWKNSGDV